MCETTQCQRISLGSEPGDHAVGAKRDVGVVAEFLALVDVRNMNFDHGAFERIECIEDSDRCMGERSGIDYDTGCNLSRLVDPVDDLILTVRLMKVNLKPVLCGDPGAIRLDVGKSFVAVD